MAEQEVSKRLEELEKENQELKKQLEARKEAEPEKKEVDPRLLEKACKAYGIDKQYVFSSAIGDDGAVVIVTNGGSKVRWFEGDKPEPLDQIAVTGINPKAAKRKVVAGKAKK